MAKKPMPKPAARAITTVADFPEYITHDAVALLARYGVTTGFYYDPEFPVANMTSSRSRGAQIRDEEYVPEHLDRLVASAKADPKQDWAAVILWWDGSCYVNLDGNHRREMAVKTKRDTFPAIIVELTGLGAASKANQIAVNANQKHGLRLTNEEAYIRGAVMVCDEGISVAQAARTIEVPMSSLAKYCGRFRVEKRAINGGVHPDLIDIIPASSRSYFDRIGNNVPFKEAVVLAAESHMEGHLIDMFTKEIEALRDNDAQREYIATIRTNLEAEAAQKAANKAASHTTSTGGASIATRKVRALSAAATGLESAALTDSLTTPAEIDEVTEAIEATIQRLRGAQRRLRSLSKARTATSSANTAAAATAKAARTPRTRAKKSSPRATQAAA